METVEFLVRVDLFKRLNHSAPERLATQVRVVHFSRGHIILDTTMEPIGCYFLPREAFMNALENNPEIAVGMLPGLGTMVRNADRWIAQLL